MGALWRIVKAAVAGYVANDALSRGASIAFYAATSLAPTRDPTCCAGRSAKPRTSRFRV